MDLRDYLRMFRKRWRLIVACLAIGVGGALSVIGLSTKVYEASAQVFVATASSTDNTQLAQGNTFVQARVQSYTSIAVSPSVIDPVIKQLNLNLTTDQLAGQVSADAPTDKVLLNIHVRDRSPAAAARIANAVAAQFTTVVERLEATSASRTSPVKLSVTDPATPPGSPASPRVTLDVALGVVIGLIVGIGLVVLRETLDTVVRTVPQLTDTLSTPVLAAVTFDKRAPGNPFAFRSDPHGSRAESYRHLRTNLQFIDVDSQPRVIAITSAMSGEGKTSTALNLAAGLAEAGFRVCLLEADLRRPTLAKSLGLVADAGLTSVLVGKAKLEDVMQNAGKNLAVLTSGPVPPNPSELIASQQVRKVVAQISGQVDYTIIDTAPLLPVADGAEMAAMADATLLVVRAGKTHRDQVIQSQEALARVGKKVSGSVLNMASNRRGRADYGYYYYGSYSPAEVLPTARPAAGTAERVPAAPPTS